MHARLLPFQNSLFNPIFWIFMIRRLNWLLKHVKLLYFTHWLKQLFFSRFNILEGFLDQRSINIFILIRITLNQFVFYHHRKILMPDIFVLKWNDRAIFIIHIFAFCHLALFLDFECISRVHNTILKLLRALDVIKWLKKQILFNFLGQGYFLVPGFVRPFFQIVIEHLHKHVCVLSLNAFMIVAADSILWYRLGTRLEMQHASPLPDVPEHFVVFIRFRGVA